MPPGGGDKQLDKKHLMTILKHPLNIHTHKHIVAMTIQIH